MTLRYRASFGSTNEEAFNRQVGVAIRMLETKGGRDFGDFDETPLPRHMRTTDPDRLKRARILRQRLEVPGTLDNFGPLSRPPPAPPANDQAALGAASAQLEAAQQLSQAAGQLASIGAAAEQLNQVAEKIARARPGGPTMGSPFYDA